MRTLVICGATLLLNAYAQMPSLQAVAELPDACFDLQFISPLVGWCRTDKLFKTQDGGTTWSVVTTPNDGKSDSFSVSSNRPEQVQFLNAQQGWVLSFDHFYWTHDGGGTWKELPLPLQSGGNRLAPRGLIRDVHFSTPDIGWVLGDREIRGNPQNEPIRYRIASDHSIYVPALFRTDDGGHTWKALAYPDLKGVPYQLRFADAQYGLSIELNELLYTHDGGRSWHKSKYCASVDEAALHEAEIGTGMFSRTDAQLLDAKYGWWTVQSDLFRT